jgi:V8-like Glu-specific endopeptidase
MKRTNARRNQSVEAARGVGSRAPFLLVAAAAAALGAGCADGPSSPDRADESGVDEAETICGARNDMQNVNSYNGALGVSVDFVNRNKTFVGAMESFPADNAPKFCSGTLIANDLFLTAGHCVEANTVGQAVAFNFERAANGATLLQQAHFRITQVVEDDVAGLDYAIVRLEGDPGATFGVAPVAGADAAPGATIAIIGHPQGQPKQVEAGSVARVAGNFLSYGNVDTLGGNSGSGILDAQGRVVGVHTLGGCSAAGGANSGVRISRIIAASNVLQLTAAPAPARRRPRGRPGAARPRAPRTRRAGGARR